jgi:hypothetical protein
VFPLTTILSGSIRPTVASNEFVGCPGALYRMLHGERTRQ